MYKIITKKTQEVIDIEDIVSRYDQWYVFYLSKNKSYPVFLKSFFKQGEKTISYGFSSTTIVGYTSNFAYLSNTVRGAINKASESRTLYAIHKDNYRELFNPQILID